MSDSVGPFPPPYTRCTAVITHPSNCEADRVFAHALQTVRRIPGTGSARPPPEASLKLYGLYKQSMEGDVSHVMPRPARPAPAAAAAAPPNARHAGPGTIATDTEKWDAWDAQRGLSRTEAKRRYITTLIEVLSLPSVWTRTGGARADEGEEGEDRRCINMLLLRPRRANSWLS